MSQMMSTEIEWTRQRGRPWEKTGWDPLQ